MSAPVPSIAPPRTQRIGQIEPLGRNAVRTVATIQGEAVDAAAHVWEIGQDLSVQVLDNGQDDPERGRLWKLLGRLAATAKFERAQETHALAVEAVALVAPREAYALRSRSRCLTLRRRQAAAADSLRDVIRGHEALLSARREVTA